MSFNFRFMILPFYRRGLCIQSKTVNLKSTIQMKDLFGFMDFQPSFFSLKTASLSFCN